MKKFILGILFTLVGIPVIDNLIVILTKNTELYSWKIDKKIYDIQKEMNIKEQENEEKNLVGFSTSCIGYEINNDEIEEEQE